MGLIVFSAVLWALAGWMLVRLARRHPDRLGPTLTSARDQAVFVAPRLLMGLAGAGFVAALLPDRAIAEALGPESGLSGILIACLAGALTPGGPIVGFAIAAAADGVAGPPQIVAYVSAWSFISLNRTLVWELPVMGGGFVRLRIAAAAPILAVVCALALALL